VGPPSVIRPVTGAAGPTRAGAIAVPGAAAAPEHCSQAVVSVPWPPPGTRRPWQVAPAGRISCGARLCGQVGRGSSARDDARAHEPLATGRTPLGMGLPTLGTHRLPVPSQRDHHRRLPERRAAQRQGRSVAGMVQPLAPHGPRLGDGHMPQPALEKVRNGQGHLRDPRTCAVRLLLTGAAGEGDAGAVVRPQTAVLDGTAP
jgi:hypothetical protein